eukprot:scaffold34620_cov160-Amphora_coffeaeformis.AAC.17
MIHHGRTMGMPCRRWRPLQGQNFSPSHGGEVKCPKIRDPTRPIKASVYVNGISKGHSHVPITRTGWWSRIGRRQDG